jgi:mannose-1-phosphate guanylyltransferase
MKIILLSGGSGKRLWPLSNHVNAKQFLKVLRTEDGKPESMIQRIYRQLDSIGLVPSTHIITCQSQVNIIKHQIGDNIPIICEPNQRDTFPSISLAITYLYSILQVDPDETIVVLPVDSFVELSFFQLLNKVPDILRISQSDFALIGVTPQFPSDQYGYIVPQINAESNYYSILQFMEKPSLKKAESLMKKKALWNCGVFSFSLKFMLIYLENRNLPTVYDQMLDVYDQLPQISFDYEVLEKANRSVVIPYEGLWRDLGSWDALAEHLENNIIGKGVISEDSMNTHIVNELSTPIHVIGISDSIIVAGPDGILVSDKKKSSRIKQMIIDDQPFHEESAWGSYRVLDYSITDEGTESVTKMIQVLPGKNISYQKHNYRTEVWTVISGTGECILNNKHFPIKAGDTIQIPLGAKHGVKAITPLRFIEVQLGKRTEEGDIIRFTYSWEEAIMDVTKEE